VAGLPSFHFRSITLFAVGSIAVRPIRVPNASPSPARTPLTTSTPGTPRSACSDAIDVGVNPFCDVSA